MTSFLILVVAILGLFAVGWYILPKGWLTRSTAGLTGVFVALGELFNELQMFDWSTILPPAYVPYVNLILMLLVFVAYGRKKEN